MKAQGVVRRFLLQTAVRFEPASGGPMLNAALVKIDDASGRALSIERIFERITFSR